MLRPTRVFPRLALSFIVLAAPALARAVLEEKRK
jgi:hypothetical protein